MKTAIRRAPLLLVCIPFCIAMILVAITCSVMSVVYVISGEAFDIDSVFEKLAQLMLDPMARKIGWLE